MKAYQKRGFFTAPGIKIGYVLRDASKWDGDIERDASGFDAGYYRKLLGKEWNEAFFAIQNANTGTYVLKSRPIENERDTLGRN